MVALVSVADYLARLRVLLLSPDDTTRLLWTITQQALKTPDRLEPPRRPRPRHMRPDSTCRDFGAI